jgi:hypothetical protein
MSVNSKYRRRNYDADEIITTKPSEYESRSTRHAKTKYPSSTPKDIRDLFGGK